MAYATRKHRPEFLPGGICVVESIADEDRELLSSVTMMSRGTECLFALGREHNVRAGASLDDVGVDVICGHADGTAACKRERANGKEEAQQHAWRSRRSTRQLSSKKSAQNAQRGPPSAAARIDYLPLAEHYSDLKLMDVEDRHAGPA
eukprot:1513524-Pleurochrysis_carterae.AAC.3